MTRKTETPDGYHIHFNGGGLVADTATVDDTAFVGPSAKVYENAWVYGNAKVDRTPIYIQGSRYWIGYCGEPGQVTSGCINKPLVWWLEHVERCAEENGYNEIEQKEYRLHIENIAAWMRLYGLDKEQPHDNH